jgi:hypothetical protein
MVDASPPGALIRRCRSGEQGEVREEERVHFFAWRFARGCNLTHKFAKRGRYASISPKLADFRAALSSIGGKSVVRMPSWISKMVTTWQIEPYPRRIDAYLRLKRAIYQGFEHKIRQISCSTNLGKVMSQNGFRAKLCVRETAFDSSIQAHWTGDFMRQKWRIYGLSDNGAHG